MYMKLDINIKEYARDRRLITVAIKFPWPTSRNHGFHIFHTSYGYERLTTVTRDPRRLRNVSYGSATDQPRHHGTQYVGHGYP